ncbi:6,7-dimethyl-8-ribityllumazine synthase [Desertibaculum subflavum]|uniref:6,7-dimethyl-8-ribityllumazine synthase n=1 Tax=Desertibaculum subflavum TaxID=2268458 RepID=UPI000E66850D
MAQNLSGPKVLLVEARYYEDISDALATGAMAALEQAGAQFERLTVPGALEIPGAIRMALGRFDAFVALGCVIRGETTHYDIVSNESARGLMQLTLDHAVPIGNGIITVEDEDQAWARAKPDDLDKGGGAAKAALRMLEIKRSMETARS